MKDYARSFYNSKKWKSCRESYIANRREIDGGLCEVCGKRIGYIVHHKILLTPSNINDPDISLNHSNLRWECKACHDLEEGHFYDANGYVKPAAIFGSDGQPIAIRAIDRE